MAKDRFRKTPNSVTDLLHDRVEIIADRFGQLVRGAKHSRRWTEMMEALEDEEDDDDDDDEDDDDIHSDCEDVGRVEDATPDGTTLDPTAVDGNLALLLLLGGAGGGGGAPIAAAAAAAAAAALRLPVDGLDQSPNRLQAFFHLHWVHHWSLWSMPYTLRHFLFSPRVLRFGETGERCWPLPALPTLLPPPLELELVLYAPSASAPEAPAAPTSS
uniref:Uncharacterized protein n=1 Tax=Anopheles farauti TaxID=69004 RepID=A0A182QWT8_9DIPT